MKPSKEAIRAAVRLGSDLQCDKVAVVYSGETIDIRIRCKQPVQLHNEIFCGCFAWCGVHGAVSPGEVRLA